MPGPLNLERRRPSGPQPEGSGTNGAGASGRGGTAGRGDADGGVEPRSRISRGHGPGPDLDEDLPLVQDGTRRGRAAGAALQGIVGAFAMLMPSRLATAAPEGDTRVPPALDSLLQVVQGDREMTEEEDRKEEVRAAAARDRTRPPEGRTFTLIDRRAVHDEPYTERGRILSRMK